MQNQKEWLKLHTEKRHQPRYPMGDTVSFVFRNFPKNGKILDLGCGAGRNMKFLAENGFDAYGCDYSSSGIEASKALLLEYKLKGDLQVASVGKLPYEDDFFDGLICYGVLCYNDKNTVEKAADEIYRVMKKGSKAYIVVRNLDDYRYETAKKIDKYQTIIQEEDASRAAFKENGMFMYFFDKEEVKRVFYKFYNITINRLRVSFNNDSFANDDFAIICQK